MKVLLKVDKQSKYASRELYFETELGKTKLMPNKQAVQFAKHLIELGFSIIDLT